MSDLRPIITCACGCGRTGERRGSHGYVRACYERWRRAGCPDSGPPAPTMGRPPTTTGQNARRRAASARHRWAAQVAVEVVAGAEEPTPGWEQAGPCRDLPDDWSPDAWFPEEDEPVSENVLTACDACPVRRECLLAALVRAEEHGIWAGTNPLQRSRMLAAAKRDNARPVAGAA